MHAVRHSLVARGLLQGVAQLAVPDQHQHRVGLLFAQQAERANQAGLILRPVQPAHRADHASGGSDTEQLAQRLAHGFRCLAEGRQWNTVRHHPGLFPRNDAALDGVGARRLAHGDDSVRAHQRASIKPLASRRPPVAAHAMTGVDDSPQTEPAGRQHGLVMGDRIVGVQYLGGVFAYAAPRTRQCAQIQTLSLAAGMHRNLQRRQFLGQRALLVQAHHLATVSLPMLDLDQLQNHAFQPAAIQVFHEVRDVQDGSSDTVTRSLPLGVSGISSTKWQSSSTLSPSTLATSRRM